MCHWVIDSSGEVCVWALVSFPSTGRLVLTGAAADHDTDTREAGGPPPVHRAPGESTLTIERLLALGSVATSVSSSCSRLAPEASDTGPRKIGAPSKAHLPREGNRGHRKDKRSGAAPPQPCFARRRWCLPPPLACCVTLSKFLVPSELRFLTYITWVSNSRLLHQTALRSRSKRDSRTNTYGLQRARKIRTYYGTRQPLTSPKTVLTPAVSLSQP